MSSNDNYINDSFSTSKPFIDFGDDFDMVGCFDENGSASSLKYIQKAIKEGKDIDENRRFFTLTCCLFKKVSYKKAFTLIAKLKKQYWKEEKTAVVLHTRDIVKKQGYFSFGTEKKYERFLQSLSTTIDLIDCKIISITFDLLSYVEQYYQYDPYEVAFDIILETIIKSTRDDNKIAIVFESRGNKEDKTLREHISKIILKTGTKRYQKDFLQIKFPGVFFNPKVSKDGKTTYHGIEIADLCSYPIYRYMRFNTIGQDFDIVCKKIVGFKADNAASLRMKGLRRFPKEWQK